MQPNFDAFPLVRASQTKPRGVAQSASFHAPLETYHSTQFSLPPALFGSPVAQRPDFGIDPSDQTQRPSAGSVSPIHRLVPAPIGDPTAPRRSAFSCALPMAARCPPRARHPRSASSNVAPSRYAQYDRPPAVIACPSQR